jgi:hypothetical protein
MTASVSVLTHYRFYFLDYGGHIAKTLDIELSFDNDAIELARLKLSEASHYHGIDVWQGLRKVFYSISESIGAPCGLAS